MRPRVLSPSAALSLTRRYATSTTGRLPYGSQGSNRFSDFLESGEGSMADAPMDNAAEDKALPAFKYHGNFGKPKTASLRHLKAPYSPWLWPGKPMKHLTTAQRKNGGRSKTTGRIIRRHIGGGHRRRFRKVDFMRLESGPHDVVRIEYDPGRSAHIALLRSRTGLGQDGGWSYIVAPDGCRAGDVVTSYRSGVPKGLVPNWDKELEAKEAADKIREAEELKLKAEAEVAAVRKHEEFLAAKAKARRLASGASKEEIAQIEAGSEAEIERQSVNILSTLFSASSIMAASGSSTPPAELAEAATIASSSSHTSLAYADSQSIDAPRRPKAPSIQPLNLHRLAKKMERQSLSTHAIGGGSDTPSFAINLLRSVIVKSGNVIPLGLAPIGQILHNVTLAPDGPAVLCRAAGTSATVIGHMPADIKTGIKYSMIKLQSGEVRKIRSDCYATCGQVSNKLHNQRSLGKAGRNRWLGRRPRVRGLAMNAVDHPHGGGRGKSKSNEHPKSIWGWLTRGVRTRKPGVNGDKHGNKMVIRERPRGKAQPAKMERTTKKQAAKA